MNSETFFVRYRFTCGPGKELVGGAALEVNCQSWAHRVLRERFGIALPSWLLSKEVFEDEEFVTTIAQDEDFQPADIFLFGTKNATDMRTLHWAIFVGRSKKTHEPILEHVNRKDGTVGIWTLHEFAQVPQYEKLFAVKRPKQLT